MLAFPLRLASLAATVAAAVSAAACAPALAAGTGSVENRSMYNDRYCEYLFIHLGGPSGFYADVWNTYGLNDCPASLWARSKAEQAALRKEMGAVLVKLNGPRHWLIDRATITFDRSAKLRQGIRRTFSTGLEMRRLTTGDVPKVKGKPGLPPFTETTVNRTTHFTFSRRHPLRVLVTPGGRRYAMQAYSQIRDPGLTEPRLNSLGPKLKLPPGWDYRVFSLRKDLTLRTSQRTTVLQDDLENTYQLVPRSAYRLLK